MMLTLHGYTPAAQLALPGFDVEIDLSRLTRRVCGQIGEVTAWAALEKAGYLVSRAQMFSGDLRAVCRSTGEVFKVEVKTARRGKDGRYRFTLRNAGTDVCHADVLVLLAVLDNAQCVAFVLPTSVVCERRALRLQNPLQYAGWLAPYRQLDALRLAAV